MTRQSLKDIIAGLDLPARYVPIPPGERATSAQDFRRSSAVVAATGAGETRKQEAGA
jgi:hypothetical protein